MMKKTKKQAKEELYFISGNVPALKNSKQWTGKYLVKSKRVTEYLRLHGIKNYSSSKKEVEHFKTSMYNFQFMNIANQIKEELSKASPPYKIGFHFVRNSNHKFDFGNAFELISDLFTAYNVWEDDNMDYFLPFPLEINGTFYTFDKINPGVFIKILP
jgi:hypothetical protein